MGYNYAMGNKKRDCKSCGRFLKDEDFISQSFCRACVREAKTTTQTIRFQLSLEKRWLACEAVVHRCDCGTFFVSESGLVDKCIECRKGPKSMEWFDEWEKSRRESPKRKPSKRLQREWADIVRPVTKV